MIKIYVANLAKYNEGKLVGEWLELPMAEEDLDEAIEKILGFDEEVAIHDYEAPFKIEEYDNIQKLNEFAEQLDSLDDHDYKKVLAIIEWGVCDLEDAIDSYDNYILYEDIHTEEQYGDYLINESGIVNIPDDIIFYIDTEKLGRDWYINLDGTFTEYGLIEAC